MDKQTSKRKRKQRLVNLTDCLCGHSPQDHQWPVPDGRGSKLDGPCRYCFYEAAVGKKLDNCKGYKTDNLDYIEKLAKQRKLI